MTNKYVNAQLDDVIFESCNKAYGAYALRQAYGKNIKRGTIAGLSLFALLVSNTLIVSRFARKSPESDFWG
ncbi:MAG: hypothetical protein U5L45_21470 [Saprospiraceae bacterium]|nr:hypothetical protein [Saprospiraceae bacterium]